MYIYLWFDYTCQKPIPNVLICIFWVFKNTLYKQTAYRILSQRSAHHMPRINATITSKAVRAAIVFAHSTHSSPGSPIIPCPGIVRFVVAIEIHTQLGCRIWIIRRGNVRILIHIYIYMYIYIYIYICNPTWNIDVQDANFPLGFAPENGPHQVSNFL